MVHRLNHSTRSSPLDAGVTALTAATAPPAISAPVVSAPIRTHAVAYRPGPQLTFEGGAYLVLIGLAILTRFWDLGSRAMMHDETIHTYYSWLLSVGNGYVHDPLSHGPFLFHANALVYLLLGDTDATSRFMPALFGVILVALPWLLRGPQHLGRWGALAASVFFLLSPSLLYYTRFIRHDPYTIVGTLLLFIAIVRFIEKPDRRWLILGGTMLGFLYTNHEIIFAILALFVAFILGSLLFGRLRPLLPVGIAAGAFGLAIVLLYGQFGFGGALPAIPWDGSGTSSPAPTPENQRQYYVDLISHPLTLSILGLGLLFVVVCWRIIRSLTVPDAYHIDATGRPVGWVDTLFRDSPDGSVEAGVRNAWRDKTGLQIALAVAIIIIVVLFTTVFTNLGGLATGTIATDGTLLYWLGQQDVQRGSQPWFYFITLSPQYEFLALAFGLPAIALTFYRALVVWLGRRDHDRTLTFRIFVTIWAIGIFAGLSYAGEKMPWLIVHIALPLILLAASLVNELAETWIERRTEVQGLRIGSDTGAAAITNDDAPAAGGHGLSPLSSHLSPAWVGPALAVALLSLAGGWLLLAGRLTYPVFVQGANGAWARTVSRTMSADWWMLALPVVIAVALLGFAWWLIGGSRTARTALMALTVGLLLMQVHTGWRLSFLEGDVARDGIIYNTTTPDVTRMVTDIEAFSYEMTGGLDLEVQYGEHVDWPLNWYMRNFDNAFQSSSASAATDVPIIVFSYQQADQYRGQLLGYTEQQYILRWHEPEYEIYRNFAIAPELEPYQSAWGDAENPSDPLAIAGSIVESVETLTTQEGQQRLWRLVMYRENPDATMNWGYSIFVRNDLLPMFNTVRYDYER